MLNRFATIAPYVTWGFIGLVVSYIVTIIAWNILEPRMFKCTDDVPFVPLPGPISDHKQAGDTLLPGWTWTKVRIARLIYLTTFFALWFAIAASPYWAHRYIVSSSSVKIRAIRGE